MGVKAKLKAYDVAVAYRIYPGLSKPASGLPFAGNKYLLSAVCLQSFKESLSGLRVKIWVLLDGCPPQYRDLFLQYFDAEDLVFADLDRAGNQGTFEAQIDLLLSQTDAEVVYFAEDDYFYLPKQFSTLVSFLRAGGDVDFVSPYDHPDCFRLDLHRGTTLLRSFGGRYWSSAASACLTFLTRQETLRKTQHCFRTYCFGNHDCSVWLILTKHSIFSPLKLLRGLARKDQRLQARIVMKAWVNGWKQILFGRKWKLWMPTPGVATHLDADAIPPSFDWLSEISKKIEDFRVPSCQE